MNVSPARKAAFDILCKVEKENAFTSILLPHFEENLEPKDRSLCHEIVLGSLRKQIYLDEIIKKFTKKNNLEKFDAEVLVSLRIGLYQLLFLDKIPAYSAINESVNLIKIAKKKSASGLVNAVLRRSVREKVELNFTDEVERIAVENSHPRWLVEKWMKQFGLCETEKLVNANNETPKISFRLTRNFYEMNTDEQANILLEINYKDNVSTLVESGFTADNFDDKLRDLANENLIYFQDQGSQMIASLIELQKGQTFIDVCAAPGSKITFAATQNRISNNNAEMLLVGGDLHTQRMRILQQNCFNQGIDFVELVQYDALQNLPFAIESFDFVLVDAPCTGTGTIRNNPEIRYNLNRDIFSKLAIKQLAMLDNASKLVKSSGTLIYSTCSMEVEENEEVIEQFLILNREFTINRPNLSDKFITENNFARTFPQRDNTDGFFIAVLQKS